MSELYSDLGNTEYGETLNENIRFGRFKPDWLENWAWVEMLGPDVNNLEHMEWTAGITAWYIFEAERLGTPLSAEDQDTLMTVAFTHDFAEAIDGDIPDPDKKFDDETMSQERRSFEAVASSVTDNYKELADIVLPVVQGSHPLARDFRAIEIIGYMETGYRARYLSRHMGEIQHKYDFDKRYLNELYHALKHLGDEVIGDDTIRLNRDFGDLPVVKSYLNNKTYEGAMDASRPYRMAAWLQDAVVEYCSTSDYTVGRTERDDIAEDLINSTVERNGMTLEEAYTYLQHWRTIYNRGFEE